MHLRIAAVARRNIMVDTQKSCQLAGMTCEEYLGGDDPQATVTGQHFYHQEPRATHPDARSTEYQDALLAYCAHLIVTAIDA